MTRRREQLNVRLRRRGMDGLFHDSGSPVLRSAKGIIAVEVRLLGGEGLAGVAGRGGAGPAGILPLRLRGQAVAPSCLLLLREVGKGRTEGDGQVPGEVLHGMVRSAAAL